jgi:hypothetical protein
MPSRQVSRKALTCSGPQVMRAAFPSLTSRLVVDHWKLLYAVIASCLPFAFAPQAPLRASFRQLAITAVGSNCFA